MIKEENSNISSNRVYGEDKDMKEESNFVENLRMKQEKREMFDLYKQDIVKQEVIPKN